MSVTLIADGSCLGNPGPGGWAAILKVDVWQCGHCHLPKPTELGLCPKCHKFPIPTALTTQQVVEKVLTGHEDSTTNNRMELMAVIRGLEALKRHCTVKVIVDSEYVRKGMTEWIKNWQANRWMTSDKKPVKNRDLWLRLLEVARLHVITWEWTKGHAGHPDNERCDGLANAAARGILNG